MVFPVFGGFGEYIMLNVSGNSVEVEISKSKSVVLLEFQFSLNPTRLFLV